MTIEVWKPIIGFEKQYLISNMGRVKSLERRAPHPLGGTRFVRDRLLKLNPSPPCGHLKVTLTANGHSRYAWVHQLVLETFVEPRPIGLVACHNDNDPTNNQVFNLRWDTRSNNMLDKARHGTMVRGEASHLSKLTKEAVIEIRRAYAAGERSQRQLAARFGVTPANIYAIVNRRSWKHIP